MVSMPCANEGLLGKGLYTPRDAAHIARIHPQTLNHWLFGSKQREAALHRQLDTESKLVGFLDLIQLLAVRAIRKEKKIPLQKIREFIERADNEFGIKYPFAMRHTTYLYQNDIVLRVRDKHDEEHLIELTGKHKGQNLHKPIVELYQESLDFDSVTGQAARYTPFEYKNFHIVLDPNIRLGQPLVQEVGYSMSALVNAVENEGGIDPAANVTGIDPNAIRCALVYDDLLRGIAA